MLHFYIRQIRQTYGAVLRRKCRKGTAITAPPYKGAVIAVYGMPEICR